MKPEILMGELIGKQMHITKSVRKELLNTKGLVIDETMNTFIIEKGKRQLTIPKKLCSFTFDGSEEVNGKLLNFRPEDRIKKYWRKFNGKMRRQKLSNTRAS